jgi:hypothetical protein
LEDRAALTPRKSPGAVPRKPPPAGTERQEALRIWS